MVVVAAGPAAATLIHLRHGVAHDVQGCWFGVSRSTITRGSTQALRSGLVELLAAGPPVQILAAAGNQDLGAETAGQVVTPPHRKFRDAPAWNEELHADRRHAHSVQRIRVDHGIAHPQNRRTTMHEVVRGSTGRC